MNYVQSHSKPRILIIIDTYPIGGPGKLILQHLESGAKDYCEPFIAGCFRGPPKPWPFRDAVVKSNIPFIVFKQSFAFDPIAIIQAIKTIRSLKIDLVESHGYKGHLIALFACLWTRRPWLSYVHGWTQENRKVLFYNWTEKVTVRFSDRIITVSNDMKQRLELNPNLASKAVVIKNALRPSSLDGKPESLSDRIIPLEFNEKSFTILTVGRLSPEKGFLVLIRAVHALQDRIPDLKLIILGQGPEERLLEEEIRRCNLQGKVLLAGPKKDPRPYYEHADIYCQPSISEGIPLALMEAMDSEKPVIASHVGGMPEVIAHNETGLLVPPNKPDALADAIFKLFQDPQKRAQLGQAAQREMRENYSTVQRTQKVLSIYDELLKGAHPHH
jgi:glycosyltransferase involved in cell wall biosynthesis